LKKLININFSRGNVIESSHRALAMISDLDSNKIFDNVDDNFLTYPRSAVKSLQCFLLTENRNISEKQVALACASHHGANSHISEVSLWLNQLHLDESNLVCGAQTPYDIKSEKELILKNQSPSKLHNNCSGKHLGLLQVCRNKDWPLDYWNYDHPIQLQIRNFFSEITHHDFKKTPWGIDGCGIPTYACSLDHLSKMSLELLKPSGHFIKVKNAVKNHPEFVGGEKSLCTRILKMTDGRVFAKVGAEGVYFAVDYEKKLSIVLKILDGASRAAEFLISRILLQTGSINENECEQLVSSETKNWSGQSVGHISSDFNI